MIRMIDRFFAPRLLAKGDRMIADTAVCFSRIERLWLHWKLARLRRAQQEVDYLRGLLESGQKG